MSILSKFFTFILKLVIKRWLFIAMLAAALIIGGCGPMAKPKAEPQIVYKVECLTV